MTRNLILGAVLVMIGFLAFMTIAAIADVGVTGLSVVSLVILALFGFGIVGALTHRPDE